MHRRAPHSPSKGPWQVPRPSKALEKGGPANDPTRSQQQDTVQRQCQKHAVSANSDQATLPAPSLKHWHGAGSKGC